MQSYQAYISTHLRDYILAHQPPNREALLEDAILNNYYRLAQHLIDTGILKEITYYFTYRDTHETRIHRPLDKQYNNGYVHIHPSGNNAEIKHTKDIEHFAPLNTASVALQMAARYGNLKSYILVEDAMETLWLSKEIHLLGDDAIRTAAIQAISRDEIELFNYIRDRMKNNTEHLIYCAQSLRCIQHFTHTTSLREKRRLNKQYRSVGYVLCWRRRWDLFQVLVPKSEWYNSFEHAVIFGFTELLNEFTIEELETNNFRPINTLISSMEEALLNPDALIRTFTWLKPLQPDFMEWIPFELLVLYMTPELLDWYHTNGYRVDPNRMTKFINRIFTIIARRGCPSVEIIAWEACLCKLRDTGIQAAEKATFTRANEWYNAQIVKILQKYPEYFTIVDPPPVESRVCATEVGSDIEYDINSDPEYETDGE